ncbi:hypothetical protein [Pseudalkalibacillus sp. R45]
MKLYLDRDVLTKEEVSQLIEVMEGIYDLILDLDPEFWRQLVEVHMDS